jgi:hypothetical protein
MAQQTERFRPGRGAAVDDRLAALGGWFQSAPLPLSLVSLIEQLEAEYVETHGAQMRAADA